MIEDHAMVLDQDERREAARCLTARREDLDKERKRLEARGLRTDPIDEVLAIHRGDGATSGLVAKFAPRDNHDLFEAPDPVGDIQVVGGKSGKRVISAGAPFSQLSTDLFSGKLKAEALKGAKVIDAEGTVFELGILITTQFTKKGTLCQKDGCDRLAVEGEPCQEEGCPQSPPEPVKPPEKKEEKGKKAPEPTEEKVDAKVMENRKALAIEAINSATDMPVADRRHLVNYALESADAGWLSQAARREEGNPFPAVPKGWAPAGRDEGELEDFTGLKFSPVAEILAKEHNIPRMHLDGQGTGKNGLLTKGDVEDALNRHISATAPQA